ncbi:hypothetical protein NKI79_11915 [Mesorhizobium sp. M0340]|uniref:hypothetical protein n=1 Tax=Mesorhizobium sp. M0340 TaxID=2956939 RepID=UPI0033378AE2
MIFSLKRMSLVAEKRAGCANCSAKNPKLLICKGSLDSLLALVPQSASFGLARDGGNSVNAEAHRTA